MRRQLPVGDSPVWSYPDPAFQLSILCQSDDHLPWFYSNFIQLHVHFRQRLSFYSPPPTNDCAYSSLNCPFLNHAVLAPELLPLLSNKDVVEFLIRCISARNYVRLWVDYFYLSPLPGYQERHFSHPVLIFGFDDRKRNMDILCYDSSGAFGRHEVGFEEILAAGCASPPTETVIYKVHNGHHPIPSYVFDAQAVSEQMSDYILSADTSARHRMVENGEHKIWGLEVYDWMVRGIDAIRENPALAGVSPGPDVPAHPGINCFRLLWEHKKIMLARIRFMHEKRGMRNIVKYYEVYHEVEQKTNKIRLTMLRYLFHGRERSLQKVTSWLRETATLEREILEGLLDDLLRQLSVES